MIMVKRLEENQAQTMEMTIESEAPTTGDHEPFKGDSDKGTGSNIKQFLNNRRWN